MFARRTIAATSSLLAVVGGAVAGSKVGHLLLPSGNQLGDVSATEHCTRYSTPYKTDTSCYAITAHTGSYTFNTTGTAHRDSNEWFGSPGTASAYWTLAYYIVGSGYISVSGGGDLGRQGPFSRSAHAYCQVSYNTTTQALCTTSYH